MNSTLTRREAITSGALAAGLALAGCIRPPEEQAFFTEGFESSLDRWEPRAHIGAEVPIEDFDRRIERSTARAAAGSWSLEVTTEGDHDDGTAWAVTELSPPREASRFEATLSAWSPSESFNELRHLVAYLGPVEPVAEEDFPDPGTTSSDSLGMSSDGLRAPLHLVDGWREYRFTWEPESVPPRLFLAVGVSVVWESDVTHYLDQVRVQAN